MKSLIFISLFVLVSVSSGAQAKSYFDAAQMYNRMLLENGNSLMQVGSFKVKGTPYLYGGRIMGKLFVHDTREAPVYLNYNTYRQTIEYSLSLGQNEEFLKPTAVVDSFSILKNTDLQIANDLLFISGKYIFDNKENFYQRVFKGPRFSLFKKYKSDLGIVSTNYIQADLRHFDLSYEYFYLDSAKNELKKIKPNAGFLKKEFKDKIDITSVAGNDDFSYDPENALIKLFQVLNK